MQFRAARPSSPADILGRKDTCHVDHGHSPAPLGLALGTARDVALLVARIGLGVLMVAHAWLEFDFGGRSVVGVGQLFDQSGVPLGMIAGPANLLLESVGGVLMIVGLAVPVIGVLMAVNMVGAWVFVHTSPLCSMDHNGPRDRDRDRSAEPQPWPPRAPAVSGRITSSGAAAPA